MCVFKYICIYSVLWVLPWFLLQQCLNASRGWTLIPASHPDTSFCHTLTAPSDCLQAPATPLLQRCRASCPQPPIVTTKSTLQMHKNYPVLRRCHQLPNQLGTPSFLHLLVYILLILPWWCGSEELGRIFSSPISEKMMKLQNQWHGLIFLQDIRTPEHDDWENGLNAMEGALHLGEKCESVNTGLIQAGHCGWGEDPHLCVTSLRLSAWVSRRNPSEDWVTM